MDELKKKKSWANSRFQDLKGLEPLSLAMCILMMIFMLRGAVINQIWFIYRYTGPVPELPFMFDFFKYLPKSFLSLSLAFLCLVVPVINLIFFRKRWARILGAVVFFVLTTYTAAYARTSYEIRPLMWTLFFLSFPKNLAPTDSRDSLWGLRAYTGSLLSIALFYALPGLWKLINGFTLGRIFEWDFGAATIATYLVTHGKSSALSEILVGNLYLSYFAVLLVAIIQISSLLIFFNSRYFQVWPFLILAFHFGSILVLQVNFFYAGIATLLVALLAPKEFRGLQFRRPQWA